MATFFIYAAVVFWCCMRFDWIESPYICLVSFLHPHIFTKKRKTCSWISLSKKGNGNDDTQKWWRQLSSTPQSLLDGLFDWTGPLNICLVSSWRYSTLWTDCFFVTPHFLQFVSLSLSRFMGPLLHLLSFCFSFYSLCVWRIVLIFPYLIRSTTHT